jgi:ribosomal protein L37AE/L43A
MQEYIGIAVLPCPWCEDLSVCFTELGNWECNQCGEHGSVEDFVAIYPLIVSML